MSSECGRCFISYADAVPEGKFVIGKTDEELCTDGEVHNNSIDTLFASFDGSLADRLIGLGIVRRENLKGKDVLLIVNPKQVLKFQ